MKLILTCTLLCGLLVGCSTSKPTLASVPKKTFCSFDQPVKGVTEQIYGAGAINFKAVSTEMMLNIYADTAGKNVIHGSSLPNPSLTFRNQTPITRVEALQLLDSVFAENGLAIVLAGEKSIKVVPIATVGQEAGPVIDLPADKLPDCGSFMVRMVRLKKSKPSELVPIVQPFAKVSNGIIPMDKERILVLRDFSSNIKQMLKVIDLAEGSKKRGAS